MKQAFLRGVCALNREAMGVFHEEDLPASIRHAIPTPPYLGGSSGAPGGSGSSGQSNASLPANVASLPPPNLSSPTVGGHVTSSSSSGHHVSSVTFGPTTTARVSHLSSSVGSRRPAAASSARPSSSSSSLRSSTSGITRSSSTGIRSNIQSQHESMDDDERPRTELPRRSHVHVRAY
jgi:hypothetical protein